MPEKTTVANILLQNDGEWINEGFDCFISGSQIVNGQKGPFMKCQLTDSQNGSARIAATFFGQKTALGDGYYFVTDGAKRTEYNGIAQVTAFQKVKIQQGQSPSGVPAAAEPIGQPVANQQPAAAPVAASPATPASVVPIHGAQVGMAINNAVNILTEIHKNDAGFYNSSDFSKELFGIASTIVRTSQAIEGGRLAPAPGKRIMESAPVPVAAVPVAATPVAPPPTEQPAGRPGPGPGGSVQNDIEDDVPF